MIRPVQLASLVLLAACGGTAAAGDPVPASVAGDTLIRPAAPRHAYTLLDSATADLDGDGTPERVELAAVVALDDEGDPLWDDGQAWMVAVRDGADTYPLLEEHLQWGGAAFWIVHEDSVATILVQTGVLGAGGGGMRLDRFVFDRARGGYARTGREGAFGHSTAYRGPPGIGILPGTPR